MGALNVSEGLSVFVVRKLRGSEHSHGDRNGWIYCNRFLEQGFGSGVVLILKIHTRQIYKSRKESRVGLNCFRKHLSRFGGIGSLDRNHSQHVVSARKTGIFD